MRSPYQDLPPQAFWRSAVVEQNAQTLAHLYAPKFDITAQTSLMTAGSCFAQHMHRALIGANWNVLNAEPMGVYAPKELRAQFGYGIYSARYGNIYTARQLLELIQEALGERDDPAPIWQRDGRFFDALRPSVEPDGLDNADQVKQARAQHLTAVRHCLEQAQVIIFTLGLTETWLDRATGRALPTAPGTIAGDYTPEQATFHNFTYPEVLADLQAVRDLLRAHDLPAKLLLTVSPVPLTATASGAHVGPATTYSKSVLRAVCGFLTTNDPDFDYFPSYEIITTPVVGGPFFAANLRQPTEDGVSTVLGLFQMAHGGGAPIAPRASDSTESTTAEDDPVCEEALLEAFAK